MEEHEVRDRAALMRAMAAGWERELLFFWGHTSGGGGVGRECLSQWYVAPFEVDGVLYLTAEHYMMGGKARLFEDTETLAEIVEASGPREAKALGRKVRGFDEERWQEHRVAIVVEGNVAKFGQHEALREFLLATDEAVLVEAAPQDRIWGIGLSAVDPRARDPVAWRGQNLLGFALMEVRTRLRDGGGADML